MFILGKVLTIKVTKSTKKVKLGSRPVEKLDGSKKNDSAARTRADEDIVQMN